MALLYKDVAFSEHDVKGLMIIRALNCTVVLKKFEYAMHILLLLFSNFSNPNTKPFVTSKHLLIIN